jgi:hypothetical protein
MEAWRRRGQEVGLGKGRLKRLRQEDETPETGIGQEQWAAIVGVNRDRALPSR